jgi:hypothetical protein
MHKRRPISLNNGIFSHSEAAASVSTGARWMHGGHGNTIERVEASPVKNIWMKYPLGCAEEGDVV